MSQGVAAEMGADIECGQKINSVDSELFRLQDFAEMAEETFESPATPPDT
jgi:hypothetical protein